jgi:two-component system, NarL family, response regulator NreC
MMSLKNINSLSAAKPSNLQYYQKRAVKGYKIIRILVADDHHLMRQTLTSLLNKETDLVVVGEANTGIEAISMATKFHPDIILMDINMPNMDGLTATRIIHQKLPQIKIIILSMNSFEDLDISIIAAGASAYLPKTEGKSHLLNLIRSTFCCAIPDL